jgi:periplasmic protein TonB
MIGEGNMQHFTQTMPARGAFSKRAVGLLAAGLLQAGFAWMLMSGLTIKDLVAHVTPPIETIFPHEKIKPTPPPATPREVMPSQVFALPPIFEVAPPPDDTALTPDPPRPSRPQAAPGDHGPLTVAGTHTIPPYPPLQLRLGNQGTVLLQLLVGPDGAVRDAKIVRSSGTEALDRAAQEWVLARWRYRPAFRGGAAVQSAVDVAVKFDLREAR